MIDVVKLDNSEKWDNIIKTFRDYDVYYLSDYCKAFELNGDGEACLIYIEVGNSRAANVVMKRDLYDANLFGSIEKNQFYDFSTPYGYGGMIIEGEEKEEIFKEYDNYCQNNNIVSEFVRFHPVLKNYEKCRDYYEVVKAGETIAIDSSSLEDVWDNFTSKNRNMIRKAEKNGLKVFWGRDDFILKEFIRLYEETMKRDNADDYYFFSDLLYQSILEDLKYNSLFFYVIKENQIISIAIFLFTEKTMHYHLSASNVEFRGLAPSNLMIYEAAKWATYNHIDYVHLGGGIGGSETDTLFKFKKSFNRKERQDFYIGKKIFNENIYNYLVELRRDQIKNDKYFPVYRG